MQVVSDQIEKKIDEIHSRLKTEIVSVRNKFDNHESYHKKCLQHVGIDGMWLEFGVYRGRSICTFAANTDKIVYGFDSFEGLPEFWDENNPKGCFGLRGQIPEGAIDGLNEENPGMFDSSPTRKTKPWPKNVKLIKGLFQDTLEDFLKENVEQVAFLHIDSDIYSSADYVLRKLEGRIVSGTVIAFDEICDYPDYRKHEIKAFAEFLIRTGMSYKPVVHQDLGYSQGCFVIL
jgi:hypothetical protein